MGDLAAAIRTGYGTSTQLPGLAADLVVTDPDGWLPADTFTGEGVEVLLAAARRRWTAPPHVAAALVWKAYSYWLAVPAVFGWVAARRVPQLSASQVLVRLDAPYAPVRLGLRPGGGTTVLPADPLAGEPGVAVVADEPALLAALRRTLLDEHVGPLLDAMQARARIGRRLLLGSLASGVAHAARRAGASADETGLLLGTLGVAGLVDRGTGADGRPTIRRRTCCLLFTLPERKFCGDCCYW